MHCGLTRNAKMLFIYISQQPSYLCRRSEIYEKIYCIETKLFPFDTFKVVSATFLLVCFICLKENTCKTRKNAFYFTSKALPVLEIINL